MDGGADVAFLAAHADAVEVCLVEPARGGRVREQRIALTDHLRVHGPWDPVRGHRHNPAKLLLDPYARALDRLPELRPELFGHTVDAQFEGDPVRRDEHRVVGEERR